MPKGTLYIVSTPIGNLEDITNRAIKILSEVDVLICEDTRRTGIMLKCLGIESKGKRFISYFDANEIQRVPQILAILENGKDCALVTNAGTPLISDPGFRIVRGAIDAGVKVVPVPGPCAAITALCASGFPINRFTFFGFLPKKGTKRAEIMRAIGIGVSIFYCPARDLIKTLEEISLVYPRCEIVIAREMTKLHEEFIRGTIMECLEEIRGRQLKGEVTLLVYVSNDV